MVGPESLNSDFPPSIPGTPTSFKWMFGDFQPISYVKIRFIIRLMAKHLEMVGGPG